MLLILVVVYLFVKDNTIIPVLTVDGNSLGMQLEIFKLIDYFLIVFLALLYAIFITLQVYSFKVARDIAKDIGKSAAGGFGAIFAGIASTAFCASCLAPLFGFLGIGFGGILFVLQYRFYIVAILMLTSIYFTSKKITKVCKC